jgi:hypothetical protein
MEAFFPNNEWISLAKPDATLLSGYYASDKTPAVNGAYLLYMLSPSRLIQDASRWEVEGLAQWAGRSVVMVRTWLGNLAPVVLWVDRTTGLVLRWQIYDVADNTVVRQEIAINALQLEVSLPPGFFTRPAHWPEHFAGVDAWGAMPRWDEPGSAFDMAFPGRQLAAPAGWPRRMVEPAQSRLTFRQTSRGQIGALTEVFAEQVSLGQVAMGDLWSDLCERSPDGRLIGFVLQPDVPIYAASGIRWYSLDDLQVHDPFPDGMTGSDLAFSPDSRYLAFFGCQKYDSHCSVYISDLQALTMHKLVDQAVAAYFAWSPDGTALAWVGSGDDNGLRVAVATVAGGAITYTGSVDWSRMSAAADSPTRAWDVPFLPQTTGLEGCVFPP